MTASDWTQVRIMVENMQLSHPEDDWCEGFMGAIDAVLEAIDLRRNQCSQ